MNSNPYAAPAVEGTKSGKDARYVDFSPILLRWERLRIVYNAVLATLVMGVTFLMLPQHVLDPVYWAAIVCGAVVANLCFLTGPAIEGYGRYFQFWNDVYTIVLFVAGLGFTALLAIGSIANF